MLAGLVAVLGFAPAFALAQAQQQMAVGQVQSVDETGTNITLTDGTKLLTPLGSVIRPRALQEGTTVIAIYLEENGDNIVTKLSLQQSAPAPSSAKRMPEGVIETGSAAESNCARGLLSIPSTPGTDHLGK